MQTNYFEQHYLSLMLLLLILMVFNAHLASGLSIFFVKAQPVLSNSSKCLTKTPPVNLF